MPALCGGAAAKRCCWLCVCVCMWCFYVCLCVCRCRCERRQVGQQQQLSNTLRKQQKDLKENAAGNMEQRALFLVRVACPRSYVSHSALLSCAVTREHTPCARASAHAQCATHTRTCTHTPHTTLHTHTHTHTHTRARAQSLSVGCVGERAPFYRSALVLRRLSIVVSVCASRTRARAHAVDHGCDAPSWVVLFV